MWHHARPWIQRARGAPGSAGSAPFSARGGKASMRFCSAARAVAAAEAGSLCGGAGFLLRDRGGARALDLPCHKATLHTLSFCRIINSLEGKSPSPVYHGVDRGTWERRQRKTTAEDYANLRKGRTGGGRRPPWAKTLVALAPPARGDLRPLCIKREYTHVPIFHQLVCVRVSFR